jgi:hypothetical protein
MFHRMRQNVLPLLRMNAAFPLFSGNRGDLLFFSRNIGIDPITGEEVPINGGGKVTGSIDGFELGAMDVETLIEPDRAKIPGLCAITKYRMCRHYDCSEESKSSRNTSMRSRETRTGVRDTTSRQLNRFQSSAASERTKSCALRSAVGADSVLGEGHVRRDWHD